MLLLAALTLNAGLFAAPDEDEDCGTCSSETVVAEDVEEAKKEDCTACNG